MATSIAKLAILLTTDTSGMQRGFSAAEGMISGFDLKAKMLDRALMGVTAGIAALAAGSVAFVHEGVRMAGVLEQAAVQLEVLTGSAEKGKAVLASVWEFAKESPFSFEDVARATKTLSAMGDSAGEIEGHIRMLGDISAGTGQNLNELAQVFGQVQQAGKLTGNELRQFNERGIPLLSELADMMGVSKAAIRGMVEESEISADMVERAFIRMTSAGGRFADMTERLNDTLFGKWEKFKDSFSMLAFQGAGGNSGWMKQLLEGGSKFMGDAAEGFRMIRDSGLLIEQAFSEKGIMLLAEMEKKRRADAASALAGTGSPDEAVRARESMQLSERISEQHEDRMKTLRKEAEKLSQSLRTPGEVMVDSMSRVNELFQRGLILPDMYGRAIEEIKDKFIDASREKSKFFGGSGRNPGVDFNTSAGASAVSSAKAEMNRMIQEQQESNTHLKKIEAALAGVATF
jgi:tape measure domain-containing protein